MPELPEVDVVRDGLHRHVRGRTITAAALTGTRVARRHAGGAADLASQVAGLHVREVDRRGKYLWLVLQETAHAGREPDPADALALIVHLGMSGQLLVSDPGAPDQAHLHARFHFDDGGTELRFVDQRTFGGLALTGLVPDPHAGGARSPGHAFGVPEPVAHIAPDPWEPVFDPVAVARRARARSSGIKRVLLDQGVVSGIGNIYADEALWRGRIHGERPAAALTGPALRRLLGHAADVMHEARSQGGTSFDALYVNVNGASGYFDRSLHVYGRAGTPCDRCGAIIRREAFMNRSSYSCPRCQPRPRVRRAG